MTTSRLAALAVLGTGLWGCAAQPQPGTTSRTDAAAAAPVRVDGSSTVAPLAELAAEDFQKAHPAIRVPISTSGTRGGFRKFVKGEIDIADASRPIDKGEIDQARANGIAFMELPLCFDAVTVVVNKDNDWARDMTVAELKTMWSKESQGKITRWSQVREGWPDEPFELFGPGKDSGTFEYFTEAIKAGASRDDYVSSEDDNRLVRGLVDNKYALGYFGYAYFAAYKDRLTAVKIRPEPGKEAVAPGSDSIRNGTYVPLSRPLFIYVNRQAAERPEVAGFVTYFLDHAAALSARKKYVPLTPAAYAAIQKRFQERKCGTAFHGQPAIGLSMDALLQREPQ